jgi:hypothetical protein
MGFPQGLIHVREIAAHGAFLGGEEWLCTCGVPHQDRSLDQAFREGASRVHERGSPAEGLGNDDHDCREVMVAWTQKGSLHHTCTTTGGHSVQLGAAPCNMPDRPRPAGSRESAGQRSGEKPGVQTSHKA